MSNLPDPVAPGNPKSSPRPQGGQIPNPHGGISPAGLDFSSQTVSPAGGFQKEQEPVGESDTGLLEEIGREMELGPELERAGVIKHSEAINVPPDVKSMGVNVVGPAQPVSPTATTITLPLTDEQIAVGLHAQIVTSLRWLAEWCIRRLKKIHVHLKNIGGKVVRQQE